MDVPEHTRHSQLLQSLPPVMDVPELRTHTPFMGTLLPRAEFPQDILDQLELLLQPPQLFYQGELTFY